MVVELPLLQMNFRFGPFVTGFHRVAFASHFAMKKCIDGTKTLEEVSLAASGPVRDMLERAP